jgi:outer membrane protein OmpA-like peptidoglycan-associated protein
MGILQTLGFKSADKPTIEAQYAPAVMSTQYGYGSYNTGSIAGYNTSGIDRNFALQVASVSRCRNLIAGVISGIEDYFVDGIKVPMGGIGSLVTFQGLTPGVLDTAGTTIKAAFDIQRASAVSAATPMATTVLKNNGADLPESQVQGLLAAWKASRASRSTAYLTSTLSVENIGFSPKDMMYNEASQYLATEIARAMNVPAYYISADMNNSMTYQNILDGRKEFMAYSLQPYICAIEDRLSMNDITNSQNQVRFAVDESFLRADARERLDIIEKMLNLDLIDVNQARQMEQLTPLGDASATNV